jgi:hypothetical protein
MCTLLNKNQAATKQQIISFGKENGYTDAQIEIAVKAAFLESSLGENTGPPSPTADNPHPTATGLYGYTDAQWAVSSQGGSKSNNADQIAAFFNDITKYAARYDKLSEADKQKVNVDEYTYIKHHDGPNATDFSDTPGKGKSIWNKCSLNPILSWTDPFNQAGQAVCPLILDLDGNGVQVTNLADGVYFDHDGNGFLERTAWVGGNDGLLVWDKNNDGEITTGNELFGDRTLMTNGDQWGQA